MAECTHAHTDTHPCDWATCVERGRPRLQHFSQSVLSSFFTREKISVCAAREMPSFAPGCVLVILFLYLRADQDSFRETQHRCMRIGTPALTGTSKTHTMMGGCRSPGQCMATATAHNSGASRGRISCTGRCGGAAPPPSSESAQTGVQERP